MKKIRFVVALTTRDNDYQQEQEAAAQETARRLGVDVEIIDANNDPLNQGKPKWGVQSAQCQKRDQPGTG